MSKLYEGFEPRAAQLDLETRTRCTNAGIVNEGKILAAQREARAEHAALWAENPAMSVALDRELRAAKRLTPLNPEENAAQAETLLRQSTTPIYGTLAKQRAVVEGIRTATHQSPALKAALATRAGNSAPVVHGLLSAALEYKRPGK